MFKRNRVRLLWLLHTTALAGWAVTAASAQPATRNLTVGQTAIGHLQPDGPGVETWGFAGAAGRVVSVTVSSSLFEPTLQLVSPTGAELGREEEGRHERCCHPMRVVALLPADGRYLVRVATDRRAQGGAYELTVHAPTVTPLELNTPADGRYENARGAGVWSFPGRAGQIVRFRARSDGDDFVPWVQLTSPNGERLGREADPLGWPWADHLVAFLPVDGRYLVEVSDAFLSASGTYRITADTVAPAALGEIEPGGTVLRVDRPVEDVWSFGATAGQVVEVDVAVTADAFSAHYHLISPTGKVIRTGRYRQTIPLPLDGRYLLSMDDGVRADVSEVSVRPVPVTPLVDMPGAGVVGAGGGADVWGFDGVAGQVVGVRVAREGRSYLEREIISPTGELLDRLSLGGRRVDWEEVSLQMARALPVDGRYLVRLSSGSSEFVPYELAVHVLRATRLLEWGRQAAGDFSGDGPGIGIWEFDGSAGRVASVRASCEAFRCRLLLVSPSGETVGNTSMRSRPELTELLAVSGRYRVMLVADDEAVGAYQVLVDSTAVTPRPLEMNGPTVVDERDVKLLSFEGAAARVVRVTAHPTTTLIVLDVISPAGEMLAMNDRQMVVRLPLDGRYLVRARYRRADHAGGYGVAVSSVPETAETRATLRMNTPARGVLDQHGSGIGVWDFEGTAGQSVNVVVRGRDWVVQLLSPTGEELGWASSRAWSVLPKRDWRLACRSRGDTWSEYWRTTTFWTRLNRMQYEIEVRPGPATPATP